MQLQVDERRERRQDGGGAPRGIHRVSLIMFRPQFSLVDPFPTRYVD